MLRGGVVLATSVSFDTHTHKKKDRENVGTSMAVTNLFFLPFLCVCVKLETCQKNLLSGRSWQQGSC